MARIIEVGPLELIANRHSRLYFLCWPGRFSLGWDAIARRFFFASPQRPYSPGIDAGRS